MVHTAYVCHEGTKTRRKFKTSEEQKIKNLVSLVSSWQKEPITSLLGFIS